MLGLLDRIHGTDTLFRNSPQGQRHIMLLSFTPAYEQFPGETKKSSWVVAQPDFWNLWYDHWTIEWERTATKLRVDEFTQYFAMYFHNTQHNKQLYRKINTEKSFKAQGRSSASQSLFLTDVHSINEEVLK